MLLKHPSLILTAAAFLLAGGAAFADQAAPVAAPMVDLNLAADAAPGSAPEASGSDESATDLAKKLQNPVGDVYSIPFQNNTNFNAGPHGGTQDILNIQPVIPIHVSAEWSVITRTILPLVWSPSYAPASVPPFGTGATTFSAFLSPRNPVNGWVWGIGPVAQIPTASNKLLGSNVWGLGPTFVVVKLAGPIVAGGLVNNVFSLGGTSGSGGTRYNQFLFQPFFNYNFKGGWFVGTAPILTANWLAGGTKWTVPLGFQGGRLIKLGGKLPLNLAVGAYYNAIRPTGGATWQLRTQAALVF